MLKLLLISAFLLLGTISFPELHRIDGGSTSYFQIDRIIINPMSNPNNFFFDFNLPDTLTIHIGIVSTSNDTLFTKSYLYLSPGRYQFSTKYSELTKYKAGKYFLIFQAIENSRTLYFVKQEILLL